MAEALHSCICLLETMAEAAKERGDDVEWAMMSVMAANSREALDAPPAPAAPGEKPAGEYAELIERLTHFSKLLGGYDLPNVMREAAAALEALSARLAEVENDIRIGCANIDREIKRADEAEARAESLSLQLEEARKALKETKAELKKVSGSSPVDPDTYGTGTQFYFRKGEQDD